MRAYLRTIRPELALAALAAAVRRRRDGGRHSAGSARRGRRRERGQAPHARARDDEPDSPNQREDRGCAGRPWHRVRPGPGRRVRVCRPTTVRVSFATGKGAPGWRAVGERPVATRHRPFSAIPRRPLLLAIRRNACFPDLRAMMRSWAWQASLQGASSLSRPSERAAVCCNALGWLGGGGERLGHVRRGDSELVSSIILPPSGLLYRLAGRRLVITFSALHAPPASW